MFPDYLNHFIPAACFTEERYCFFCLSGIFKEGSGSMNQDGPFFPGKVFFGPGKQKFPEQHVILVYRLSAEALLGKVMRPAQGVKDATGIRKAGKGFGHSGRHLGQKSGPEKETLGLPVRLVQEFFPEIVENLIRGELSKILRLNDSSFHALQHQDQAGCPPIGRPVQKRYGVFGLFLPGSQADDGSRFLQGQTEFIPSKNLYLIVRLQANQSRRGVSAADQDYPYPFGESGQAVEDDLVKRGVFWDFLVIIENQYKSPLAPLLKRGGGGS
jgi:hypothetical protein